MSKSLKRVSEDLEGSFGRPPPMPDILIIRTRDDRFFFTTSIPESGEEIVFSVNPNEMRGDTRTEKVREAFRKARIIADRRGIHIPGISNLDERRG